MKLEILGKQGRKGLLYIQNILLCLVILYVLCLIYLLHIVFFT
jgi:hypothetical protein